MSTLIWMFHDLHIDLLDTGESYAPTAQQSQDCPIFFIQLNHVHRSKQIRCFHLMLNLPGTRWHLGFHFLFLLFNSAILHSCIFWQLLIKSDEIYLYFLPSINYFCWIHLVCICRCAFRYIVGFSPSISVLRWWRCFMISMFLTNGMFLSLFAQYWGELQSESPTYARLSDLLYTAELCT